MKPVRRLLIAVVLALILPLIARAQPLDPIAKRFARTEAMIAMRDGVKLYTTIYAPKDIKGPLPFILLRTPYGIDTRGPRLAARLPEGPGRRRLHLRLPGHSRPVQIGRASS